MIEVPVGSQNGFRQGRGVQDIILIAKQLIIKTGTKSYMMHLIMSQEIKYGPAQI